MLFVFDYGDEWRFRIEVRNLSKLPPGIARSRMTAAVCKGPKQYTVALDDD